MSITVIFVCSILAYLFGAIPSGLIIGKIFYNTDIRNYGSHNIGATNAYRVLGKLGAAAVFLCDVLKGGAGVYLFAPNPEWMVLGGILAMIGHNWPIFLKFKGGRGVATGLGVLIFLTPWVSLIVFLVWALIFGLTKYVSLGSVVAAALVPISMYVLKEPIPYLWFGLAAAFFVIIRHKDNLKRLWAGNELKIERTKKSE